MKVKNPESQTIRIFSKMNKKRICNTETFMFKYVHLCPRYLAGAPLAQPPVPLHGRDKPVALLRHYWAFSSSVLLDWLFLIFLLKISHRIHMGLRSGMLSGQSSTVRSWSANHLEVILAVWAGAKVLLEKEISISTKLVSRCKHKVLQNLLVDWCIYFELDKTQWTNASRHHSAPNHHWLWKLLIGLQAAWILCLSTLPPDSVTLISKLNAKFTFIWKEDFGPLRNSPVIFL